MIQFSKPTSLFAELQVNTEILANCFELCNLNAHMCIGKGRQEKGKK